MLCNHDESNVNCALKSYFFALQSAEVLTASLQFVKNRAIFHTVFLGTSLARIFHCSFLNPEGTFYVFIFYLIFSLSLLLILYGAKTCTSKPKKPRGKERNQSEEEKKRRMAEGIGEEGRKLEKKVQEACVIAKC